MFAINSIIQITISLSNLTFYINIYELFSCEKNTNIQIEKKYLALVYGIPKVKKARLESYLFKDNKKSMVYIYDKPKPGTVKIITSYKILKADVKQNISILEVELHTGKTHQIRAHLAHIGHPIIGDR